MHLGPEDWNAMLVTLCLEGSGQDKSNSNTQAYSSQQVPASVLAQVKGSPVLLNLLRTLAYHKVVCDTQAPGPAALDSAQQTVSNVSDALRCILTL